MKLAKALGPDAGSDAMTRSLSRWLLAAVLIAGLAACNLTGDPEKLVSKAREYREQHDYLAAIIELANAVKKKPDHAEAQYLLGLSFLDLGDGANAQSHLLRAMDLGVDPKRVLPPLAKAMIIQNKFDKVLEMTDPVHVAAAQGSVEILNLRALAQLALGRVRSAKESLELAMVMQPDYADGMLSQARIAIGEHDFAAARALVDKALAIAPNNLDGWILRGDLERLAEDNDAAREAYRKAVEIDPRNLPASLELAKLQIATGRFDEAAKQLAAVQKSAPRDVVAAHLVAFLAFRRGDYPGTRDAARKALAIAPRYVPSLLLAGLAELALGNPETAVRPLHMAVELAGESVLARRLLASAQLRAGRSAAAVETLAPVLNIPSAATDPALLELAGEAYMANRQYVKASRMFENAVAIEPKSSAVRAGLGMSRLASGETDRAIADLVAAVALGGPKAPQASIVLALSRLDHRQFDGALEAVRKLQEAQPDNPLLYNVMAAAYLGKNDVAQARAALEQALKIDPAFFPAAANLAHLDLLARRPDDARKRYEAVLAKDKNSVEAMLALADIAGRAPNREKEKEVLDWIARAKQAAPTAIAPFAAEIDYYLRTAQPVKALAAANGLDAARRHDPEVLGLLGKALLAMGNNAEALAAYNERATLLAGSPLAQMELANAQVAAKYPLAAIDSLHKALRIKPDYREAQIALVHAELSLDRPEEAMHVARVVQHDLPQSPLGYVLEGDVLMKTKKFAAAAAAYEKAYARSKSAAVVAKLYDAWRAVGKPEQGEARLKDWLAAQPSDVKTRRFLAYEAAEAGRYPLAVEQYRLVLENVPNDPVVLNNLAFALHKVRDPSAVAYARKANELKPDDAAIADTYGLILVDQGQLSQGIELLRKAVAAAPTNLDMRFHLASALAKAGDKSGAIEHLQIVVSAGGKFSQQADALALLKNLRQ